MAFGYPGATGETRSRPPADAGGHFVRPVAVRGQGAVSAIDAYETFDPRAEGWLKTVLDVG